VYVVLGILPKYMNFVIQIDTLIAQRSPCVQLPLIVIIARSLCLGLPTEINYYIITEFLLGIIIVSFVDFLQQLQSEYASELLQTAKTIG